MLKLAVFDIAGTTVDDSNAVTRSFQAAFRAFGYHVTDSMINPLMGYKKTTAIDIVLRKFDSHASDELINDIHKVFIREMEEYYSNSVKVRPMDSAEKVMMGLKDQGMKIVLNTGFTRSIAQIIIDRFRWKENGIIDDFIASDEVEEGRPNPAMINILRDRNGQIEPHQVIKIGDTEVDIREGRNANCALVVAVTTGAFSRSELEIYQPDFIIDDLSELDSITNNFA